jgi:formylglycine-generating enzyme required for sulfatase activity
MDDDDCAVGYESGWFYFKSSGVSRSEFTPVVEVTWYGAIAYCNWLSKKAGLQQFYRIEGENVIMNWGVSGYRLPTEAEWEYASRGGEKSQEHKYSGGDDIDVVGWYCDNSAGRTHRVGLKEPNELGIYDMSGNVSEWCNDWLSRDYYSKSPTDNPTGPNTGEVRIARGGSWHSFPRYCRSTSRQGGGLPLLSNTYVGFRVVLSVH